MISYICYQENAVLKLFKDYFKGANVDFWGINDFFEKTLNFECHVETDPSKEEVEGFLEETACLFNNKRTAAKYYCLLVFIMSHGNEVRIQPKSQNINKTELLNHYPCMYINSLNADK